MPDWTYRWRRRRSASSNALMCALIDPPEPWAQLSEWLQFRAELDLPLAAGGDCSDGFCRELVQDCNAGGRQMLRSRG